MRSPLAWTALAVLFLVVFLVLPVLAWAAEAAAASPLSWAETLAAWAPIIKPWADLLWPIVFAPAILQAVVYLRGRAGRETSKQQVTDWSTVLDKAYHYSTSVLAQVDPKAVAAGQLSHVVKDAMNAAMRDYITQSPIALDAAKAVGLPDLTTTEAAKRVGKALEARLGATQIAAAAVG